ncbi:MAG: hypothetical protein LBE05_04880 [Microbacterium sp.]|jgi:hypothetical protein|nr:hypothetical protein [Microbacterium sp.]
MNKTATFITFAALAALAVIGIVVLLILAPSSAEAFGAFVVQLLGIIVVGASTIYALGQTNAKLDRVEAQTNGNLSRRDAEIERLTAENIELARQIPAETGPVDTSHGR